MRHIPSAPAQGLLDDLFRRHHDNLVRFLKTHLASDADARDAAQEAYLRLTMIEDIDRLVSHRAFLYKIAFNVVQDFRRRAHVRLRWEEAQERGDAQPPIQERTIIANEQLRAVRGALEALSPSCREAFRLSRDEGMGAREIGARLGVGERMVRNYISRALRAIAEAVDGEDRSR